MLILIGDDENERLASKKNLVKDFEIKDGDGLPTEAKGSYQRIVEKFILITD